VSAYFLLGSLAKRRVWQRNLVAGADRRISEVRNLAVRWAGCRSVWPVQEFWYSQSNLDPLGHILLVRVSS
jgi:hypothetical protein